MKQLVLLHIRTQTVLRIFQEKLDPSVQQDLNETRANLLLLESLLSKTAEAYDSLEESLAEAIETALNACLDAMNAAISQQSTTK